MLATVLRTKVASEMSVSIMRAFVKMRHYLLNTIGENKYIKDMLLKHDNEISEHSNRIKLLQESFDNRFYHSNQARQGYHLQQDSVELPVRRLCSEERKKGFDSNISHLHCPYR